MNFLRKITLAAAALAGLLFWENCKPSATLVIAPNANPPATGFDEKNSDPEAVAVADEVMRAMGGRQAWDKTSVIEWKFFSSRTHVWDKNAGLVRIEWLKRPLKMIVNLRDGTGRVSLGGVEQTHPDSLKKYLELGKRAWINDSYWLVMPFKLKDSGVTLKYKGIGKTEDGRPADMLQLTFAGVGVTPENKYFVWVDSETRLVTQWAFFKKFLDTTPEFVGPWQGYERHGGILLSGSRGKDASLLPIRVLERAESGVFSEL